MVETLKYIFNIQRKQTEHWWDLERFKIDKAYREQAVINHCMGMIEQTTSLLNNFDWKKHTLTKDENIHNAIEQAIDVIKYTISLLELLGVDEYGFLEEFLNKSSIMDYKWKQNELNLADKPVVVFDLDGVICDWEQSIVNFYCDTHGIKGSSRKSIFIEMRRRETYYIKDLLHITSEEEEELKEQFIQQGGFATIIPYPGALDAIKKTQNMGIMVVCITARPYSRNKRVFVDTYNWFKQYDITPDLILFNSDKAEAITTNVLPANILVALDDRDKHCIELSHLKIPVMMPDRPYNQALKNINNYGIKRMYNWKQYLDFITGDYQ